jgi:periplasmic protein CpxP/Spy
MRLRKKHVFGLLAATGIAAGAGAYAYHQSASAHGFGWRHGGHGPGISRLCGEDGEERLDHLVRAVEGFIKFTPEQNAAWVELVATLRTVRADFDKVCGEMDATSAPRGVPAKLDRAERMMEFGLDGMRRVRPAVEALYAKLSDAQKKIVDDFGGHGRRR